MPRNNGRRIVSVQFTRGYRIAMAHARRDLARIKEDVALESEMIREEVEALRAELIELRALAGVPEPGAPLN